MFDWLIFVCLEVIVSFCFILTFYFIGPLLICSDFLFYANCLLKIESRYVKLRDEEGLGGAGEREINKIYYIRNILYVWKKEEDTLQLNIFSAKHPTIFHK